MQLFPRRRTVISACLLALGVALVAPAAGAVTLPEPLAKRKTGFRLFARATGVFEVNQVTCGLISDGQICTNPGGSSTIPGSAWPKGTNNQYTFNSGIQIAGIIGPEMPDWAGDTTGALFFEGSGFILSGEQVEPIYNASDPEDFGNWPEFARVPGAGDAVSAIYDPLLQGQITASQGDVYFLTWDGNPSATAGRSHPLGVVVETRGLAWNFPAGNQDILYFIYTLYNVSSVREADYVNIRPALKTRLLTQAVDFQARNEAAFGVDIPDGGYTIENAFMAFAADQDVTPAAGANFASFNNLFDLAVTYHAQFTPSPGNRFDPVLHAPPFLPGPGFVGTKYLRSPILPDGTEAGTVLAGLTTNRGAFPDAANLTQAYRYLSGNLNAAAGDGQCNSGDPAVTHLCFINVVASDTRTFQASGPLTLLPGGQATVVVAYIFAAPVATGKCPSIPCPVLMTPDPLAIFGATPSNPGVDAIDSAMGYLGFFPGTPETDFPQDSIRTVPNSLLGKAKVAQSIFDSKFLLPFAPTAPEFFLVPGDRQVTVLWRPSPTETNGDAFFGLASDPAADQYDPSYRQFDVEGYRVYRGRTDTPTSLQLVAQFDYAGTQLFDFRGLVNPTPGCAPELGIGIGTPACPSPFGTPLPGERFPDSVGVELNGAIVQLRIGGRQALADSTAILTATDTAVTGGNSGFPGLGNTGVPFAFTDNGSGRLSAPRNNVRYFYSVTAFDLNSFVSGPSSLESQRITRAAVPVVPASNSLVSSAVSGGLFGRDSLLTDSITPTIDAATGRFSGPFPPSDEATLGFIGELTAQIFSAGGSVKVRLDGLGMGDTRQVPAIPARYTFTAFSTADTATISVDLDQGLAFANPTVVTPPFPAALADPVLAARYGAPAGPTVVSGQVSLGSPNYQRVVAQGRGCFDGTLNSDGDAVDCYYNGPRWFAGDNETQDHPNAGSTTDGGGTGVVPGGNLNNAGALPGVATIYTPMTISNIDNAWRAMDAALGGVGRAADIKVYWGNPGKIDSVIDVTHNVPVPFMRDSMAGGFGVLNVSGSSAAGSSDARPTVVTLLDLACVEPFRSGAAGTGARGVLPTACTSAAPFVFSDSAELNPVAIFSGPLTGAQTTPPSANPGFLLYLAGRISVFELQGATLPAATVWTLRSYTGHVTGGTGAGGDLGPYSFTPAPRPFTALGAELQINYSVVNELRAVQPGDLTRVHTVPDPYYVTSGFEATTTDKVIKFVNLPNRAIIRIYTSSGVLVSILEHNSPTLGGDETWNVRNRNNQVVASGVYFYHLESGDARRVGRFTVVNFAQ